MLRKILFAGWLLLVGIVEVTNGIAQSGRQAFNITLDYWFSWQFISSRALVIYTVAFPLVLFINYRLAWGRRKRLEYEISQTNYIK